MRDELGKLYDHIDDIEVAMMTTRRADGHLQSRAMATQKRAAGADLWFVTLDQTGKLRDLADDPHVNLSYYKDRAARKSTSSTRPTGRRGFRRSTTRDMARRTIREWC